MKKVTFSKYNLRKWYPSVESEYKKTLRTKKEEKPIDMREKPEIEEELVKTHEKTYTKKELCDKRMASRDLAIQGLCNPFMKKNDYLEDLSNQDNFLRPQDSNYKKKVQ
jgi:hypothetical protein|tara:strand:- start:755 stop:1081 length:327 start_codon:yes stop_codon:yes gene_type:complete